MLFIFPVICLFPLAKSVMIVVRGEPVHPSSYTSEMFKNLTWPSCIHKCTISSTCILAYSNNLNVCYLYAVGDIIQVRNDQDGYSERNDTVAFKMRNSPSKCSNRSLDMLIGVLNPYNQNNITSYKITISPVNGNYEIDYDYTITDGCGEWLDPEPTCQNCPITMFSFHGMVGFDSSPYIPNVTSWRECMYVCYSDPACFMVFMKGLLRCITLPYGVVRSWKPLEIKDVPGYFIVAVKYIPENSTCSANFPTMYSGKTFTPQATTKYSSYKTIASGNIDDPNFLVTWISK